MVGPAYQKKSPRPSVQLNWEAEVVEYVGFLWQKTRPRGKTTRGPSPISLDIPFLGPRFVPPTYLHAQKRPGLSTITPDVQYIKPINIVHPLSFPDLACCPQCLSSDNASWEGWTGTGARDVRGIFQEEVAFGLPLRCTTCKTLKDATEKRCASEQSGEAEVDTNTAAGELGYCFATTNATYWKSWEHWKTPRKSLTRVESDARKVLTIIHVLRWRPEFCPPLRLDPRPFRFDRGTPAVLDVRCNRRTDQT